MREAFKLSPLKRPRKFPWGVYDIEAENWWDLVMIGLYDGDQYFCFRDLSDFFDHVLSPRYRGWRFFAHNGGRYDSNFLFDYLRDNQPPGVRFKFYCSGSRVVSFTVYKGREWVRFCDSYQLLPAAQKKLTEAFDVEHKKTELDIQSVEYNRNDCWGLHEVLTRFFEETGLQAETFASHALSYWRHTEQSEDLYKPPREVENLVRESYSAGRVEIFKRRGTVACYDVNSMFPWAMKRPVPVQYFGKTRRIDQPENRVAFLRCKVSYPEVAVPALPWRYGKLLFPVGEFEGVWTHFELQAAIEDGARVKVVEGALFRAETIFSSYVDRLYQTKKTAGEPKRTIAKFLLNSLYGKFGQTREKRVFELWDGQVGYFPLMDEFGRDTGIAYREIEAGSAHLLPHISACITSRSRVRLLEILREFDPFYCDTDCIFTERTLPVSEELGGWSMDLPAGSAEFYQPKLYRHGEKWKSKGLSRPDPVELESYVKREKPIRFRRHRSILEASRRGGPACQHVDVEKNMRDDFPKRPWVGEIETRPWRVQGGELV